MVKTEIIGRLTSDPTLTTISGVSACNFTVAADAAYKDESGERATEFWRVTVWRKLGDTCAKYLTKGSQVYVEGDHRINTYTSRDNEVRISLNLSATRVTFLGGNGQNAPNSNTQTQSRRREMFDD